MSHIVGRDPRREGGLTPEDRARVEGLVAQYAGYVEVQEEPVTLHWRNAAGQTITARGDTLQAAVAMLYERVVQHHRLPSP
ncbi:MAG: hypothetical protein KIS74_03040 [Burkholderiales bacterium]|nr:hypothetical protein [Burkholderiales bacterium]